MKGLEGWTEVQSKLVFPCLEELLIQDCRELKFYHNRSNMASNSQGGDESITLFPALRKLTLCEMKTLEECGPKCEARLCFLALSYCTFRIGRSSRHGG
ncbi:hypothetical protein SLE2022_315640 [Rubroshorea leprosula]